jgi:cell division protein FtsI (penicillin-binding protein 3)
MFDEINNLPADDPLRAAVKPADPNGTAQVATAPTAASSKPPHTPDLLPSKVVAAFQKDGAGSAIPDSSSGKAAVLHSPPVAPQVQQRANGSVIVDAGRRVVVPAFSGDGLRKVVETASSLGLRVEPVGSGIAREQVPGPGTQVPLGTEVVVRFER